mmetsp:Transcript_17927/g.41341  ORF Transcript_17927/g.41341 Transcript_17927/m.41341 type:complete len:467 (-) Transcript_17927:17-1417(-)
MGRIKQSRPIKRRRVILEADESIVAEEQTTLVEQQQLLLRGKKNKVRGEELQQAIELLRKTPPDQVEAAAAEATRLDLARNDRWIHLRLPELPLSPPLRIASTLAVVFKEKERIPKVAKKLHPTRNNDELLRQEQPPLDSSGCHQKTTTVVVEEEGTSTPEFPTAIYSSHIPPWSRGLGFARLASEDFLALRNLHQLIKDRINLKSSQTNNLEWASWSGSSEDPRKRAFGFLAETWGHDPQIRNNRLDITMPTNLVEENTTNDERRRNKRAMLVLEKSDIPHGVEKAIRNLCREFRTCLLTKEKDCPIMSDVDGTDREYQTCLAHFLHYEYLIAVQPNLHSGRALLPVHLDDPRKDGFGVIIVTIGMEGSGTIILRDAKGMNRGVAMRLEAGDAYMLSDCARDACAHGVLADGIAKANNSSSKAFFSERESLNLRFGLHDLAAPLSQRYGSTPPIVPMSKVLRNWG